MTGWQAGRLNLQSSDDIFAEVPDNVGRLIVCPVTAQCAQCAQNESDRDRRTGQTQREKLRAQNPATSIISDRNT